MSMAERVERQIGHETLILEVGELAGLAGGAVTVRYGDIVLLATACVEAKPRPGADFFPLTVDFEEDYQGTVISHLAERKGELLVMTPDGRGRVRLDYRIPARGLIGFRTEFLTATAGTGLLYHVFDRYDRRAPGEIGQRSNGAMVSVVNGKALAYSLYNLQNRGGLLIGHGEDVYEGMIVGVNSRNNDLPVNPTKGKQLTNIRAAGSDENIILTPPLRLSLEQALEFIDDDELVEVTPTNTRLRKRVLTEGERRRAARKRA